MANVQKRCRAWCFTINNPVEEEIAKIKKNLDECRYWVMGDEVGENGTPHKQGFLYCNNAVSFNTVRLWLLCKAHVEPCKGTTEDNIKYCTKEGKFEEHGERPMSQKEKGEKGKKDQEEKWTRIRDLARKGDWETLQNEYPKESIVHLRNLRLAHQLAIDRREDANDVTGIWFYGESGAGKSHRARHHSPAYYIKGINKWWDGYEGEDTVIIEDVSDQHKFLGDFLKIWADKWAFTAEVKGASLRKIRPGTFIVTSQYRIDEIWEDEKTRVALKRRFEEIEVVRGPLDNAFREQERQEAFTSFAQEVEMSPIPEDDFLIGDSEIPEGEMSEEEKKEISRKRKRNE